ncbi:hypothetical protein [Pseudoalteromonas piscicida]|uniref:hypothetical protein n=1 Tax=Pseudoalteromonas piscicida TaxID=43662 RepID=UPI003096BD84
MNSLYLCVSLGERPLDLATIEGQTLSSSESDFPSYVTMGFRQTLYSVFAAISLPKLEGNLSIRFLDETVELRKVAVFKTQKGFMSGKQNTFVCINISAGDKFMTKLASSPKGYRLGKNLIDALGNLGCGDALKVCAEQQSDSFIGINWYHDLSYQSDEADALNESKLTLVAFYTTAWLMLQRINRVQTSMELRPKRTGEKHHFTKSILDTRIKLLNIERFIFTKNRTKNSEVKAFCDDLVNNEEFLLKEKLDDAKQLHQSFEQHLENYTSLEQVINSEKTNGLLLLLSAGSISLTLFSASFVSVQENTLIFNLSKLMSPPVLGSLGVSVLVLILIYLKHKVGRLQLD